MTSTLLAEVLQSAPAASRPSFSILLMGKSLVSVSICALLVVGLAAKAAWRILRGGPEQRVRVRSTIDAGLFWGAFAFVAGLCHTAMGLMVTSLSIGASAPVEPDQQWLIAYGVAAAMGSTGYGGLVLLFAALLWLGLRRWHAKAVPQAT